MEHIWAPWRITYIESEKPKKCILCEAPSRNNDQETYIVFRGTLNYVILNKFPYTPGHLMVAPFRHVSSINELTPEERHEHFDIVSRASMVLTEIYHPSGYNYGINQGRISGAGIEEHMHTHIVPRWLGDTNFITVVGDVRVLPRALDDVYQKIKGKF